MAEQGSTVIVNADDYEVFMAIFPQGIQDRRSFRFKHFEKAMVGARFSIDRGTGNGPVRKFYLPNTIGGAPVNFHANHGQHARDLDRHQVQFIVKVLRKVYGWNSETFIVA
ncbi:hypothetical protein EWM64_g10293 [Hericium alpestre]|uniref:Uncharacterized protein n=1 Tax=Hericium alpestre TaxID=135208 RepID=A0A4Y9ZJW0_9AGAM|nr:hypothetical protein EWM64_g10293 [Hericium alpestre]